MKPLLKILLPVLVLGVGIAGAASLILSKDKPAAKAPEEVLPSVRTLVVHRADVPLTVTTQGTVSPRTESAVIPEVSGRVVEVSPAFVSGGFFEAGDLLLRIDPLDYEQAAVRARAQVAQAELRLALEQAEADVAREEWADLGGGDAGPLNLREPQLAEARASLEAARAGLDQALRDLERTTIRAPYAGRVRDKRVDVGQFVSRGTTLGTIYAVDFAEIRLPLPDEDLAFVDLPLVYRGQSEEQGGPEVTLRSRFAGRVHEWRGRIVRTEGEIDPRSRMVHAVARVRDPYKHDGSGRPPLAAGLFVDAEIHGRTARGVVMLPRSAVREGNEVLVVDSDDRIRLRTVEVLRATGGEVVISAGLEDGERICLTSLAAVSDGMRVRPVADEAVR